MMTRAIRWLPVSLPPLLVLLLLAVAWGQPDKADAPPPVNDTSSASETAPQKPAADPVRTKLLLGSLTVFVLAIFVGFEIITKVPPTLHTPLMSGSNAISGITLVGALLIAGSDKPAVAQLGLVAVVLATLNVVGGFLVTHRMLSMFRKR